uniref:DRBM domain-containing protein n=1 Tax=Fundulus heteroclitus TaxID=8078 RepID=A0A3Q2Q2Z9_FUNHE
MEYANYVAKLNEYTQKERLGLKYEDVGAVGPDHIKTFTIQAVVNGKAYPEGVGKNKKEAKQNAAKNALELLLDESSVSRGSVAETSPARVQQKANYTSWPNEYGQPNKVTMRAVSSRHAVTFTDKELPAGFGTHHETTGNEALDVSITCLCNSRKRSRT